MVRRRAFALYQTTPKRERSKLPPGYHMLAKEAYLRALNRKYGSHGAASNVHRVEPKTGIVISIEADGLRERIGHEYALKL